MLSIHLTLVFAIGVALLSIALLAAGATVRRLSQRDTSQVGVEVSKIDVIQDRLRPAELAYLVREGDMSHTTIVLAFDLIHRAVKSNQDFTSVQLSGYERKLWDKVKDHTKNLAKGEVKKLIPDPRTTNPMEFVRNLSGLYRMLAGAVRIFVTKVVADPRRLRRYFSFAGVARLAADLYSAGYQQLIENELIGELRQRGFLLDQPVRSKLSATMLGLSAAGAIALFLLAIAFLGDWHLAVLGWFMGGLAAGLMRLVFSLKDLIPLYGELSEVVVLIARTNWRLRLLRQVLKLITFLAYSLLAVVGIILLLVQFLVFYAGFKLGPLDACAIICAFTLCWSAILQLAIDGHHLQWRPHLSRKAMLAIDEIKKRTAAVHPVESFRQTLSSTEYDPTFSELLAVYGIETLWILA